MNDGSSGYYTTVPPAGPVPRRRRFAVDVDGRYLDFAGDLVPLGQISRREFFHRFFNDGTIGSVEIGYHTGIAPPGISEWQD